MNERMRKASNGSRQRRRGGGATALAVWALVVAAVWLVLLPGMTRRPGIQSELRRVRSQGINPSAMYYTELEMIGDVIERNERFRREHPDALWVP